MRRKDREVLNPQKIDAIIQSCDCCRLGLLDGDEVYIVPLSFGYIHEDSRRVFYFHSAAKGRKIDRICASQHATFELDSHHMLKTGEQACDYSFYYQSVMGTGQISLITSPEEKVFALQTIMAHYTDSFNWAFHASDLQAVQMIKLEVQTISCKEHLPAES